MSVGCRPIEVKEEKTSTRETTHILRLYLSLVKTGYLHITEIQIHVINSLHIVTKDMFEFYL